MLADGDCDFGRKLRILILFNGGKPSLSVDIRVLGLPARGSVLKGPSLSCLCFTKLAISLDALLIGVWSAGSGGLVVILSGLLSGALAPANGDVVWSPTSFGGLRTLIARRETIGEELAEFEVYTIEETTH